MTAEYFDQWYADMTGSTVLERAKQAHLGLPPELQSTSGLARETGARVIGVDFSRVAVDQATEAVASFGLDGSRADFRVGELESTGLAAGSVDAVMCVDAIQFAGSVVAAAKEMRRVLRPGGRVVATCWEPVEPGDAAVPERLRRLDLATQVAEGGLADIRLAERRAWRAAERGFWEAAVAHDPGADPALRSWHDEGVRSLATWDRLRRVLATGRAPSP